MLEVFENALEMRALPIETAFCGEDALTLLQERGFGCLIVDERLGDADGLDIVAAARQLQPYCACMVITAYPSRESVARALRLGAIDYLEKPFTSLDLMLERIENAITNQRNAYELEVVRQRFEQLEEVQQTAKMLETALATTSRLAGDLAEHAARLGDALAKTTLSEEVEGLNTELRAAVKSLQAHNVLLQYTLPQNDTAG
jgi:DNA-binding NtrC family response regulator